MVTNKQFTMYIMRQDELAVEIDQNTKYSHSVSSLRNYNIRNAEKKKPTHEETKYFDEGHVTVCQSIVSQ